MVSIVKPELGPVSWLIPPPRQDRLEASSAGLRPEERDAAILAGRLPLSLFDVEKTGPDSPHSPVFRRGR